MMLLLKICPDQGISCSPLRNCFESCWSEGVAKTQECMKAVISVERIWLGSKLRITGEAGW